MGGVRHDGFSLSDARLTLSRITHNLKYLEQKKRGISPPLSNPSALPCKAGRESQLQGADCTDPIPEVYSSSNATDESRCTGIEGPSSQLPV